LGVPVQKALDTHEGETERLTAQQFTIARDSIHTVKSCRLRQAKFYGVLPGRESKVLPLAFLGRQGTVIVQIRGGRLGHGEQWCNGQING
jgi:hypothetical protein